jgi:hypothetical protein
MRLSKLSLPTHNPRHQRPAAEHHVERGEEKKARP